ncbi:MAG TPA: hypothetical protein VHN55_00695 [Sphingomicrobium sp.]|nr:hypothetical protein [Sphingomicrobium sp.]
MRDTSFLLALCGMVFLAVAALAWFRIIRKPDEQPPTKKDDRRSELAAKVVVVAFGLSAVAAVIAIAGWIWR